MASDETICLAARVLPADYPRYQLLLDDDNILTSIELDRIHLIQTISRVSHLSSGMNFHKVLISTQEDTLHVSTSSKDLGEAEETLPATIDGPSQSFSLNSAQLKGALLSIDSSSILLELGNEKKPIILHPADNRDHLVLLSQYI